MASLETSQRGATKRPPPRRSEVSEASFVERFALAPIDDEGVLLDRSTGEFFRVAGPSLVAFDALLRGGDVASAARALAKRFRVTERAAEKDVRALLRGVDVAKKRPRARAISFRAEGEAFAMRVGKATVLRVRAHGAVVERESMRRESLRVVAPHVLALRGVAVLHASSVLVRDEVLAFVGPSGVGKTTLAGALVRRGLEAVGRDLLVLDGPRRARLDGERAILAWTRARTRVVTSSPVGLRPARARPLGAVFLLERGRADEPLLAARLSGAEALARLFENAFIELPVPGVWTAALETSRALAARGLVHRLRVPGSLPALRAALAAWERQGFPLVTP